LTLTTLSNEVGTLSGSPLPPIPAAAEESGGGVYPNRVRIGREESRIFRGGIARSPRLQEMGAKTHRLLPGAVMLIGKTRMSR
jgi:hypothetical protein